MTISRLALVLFFLSMCVAQAQTSVSDASAAASISPMAGTGFVADSAYTNTYYGFKFAFPSDWNVLRGPNSIAQEGGCDTPCRLLTIQAKKGTGRAEIRAIPASAEVSPKSVLSKSAAEAQDMGMKPAGVVTNFQKGGWTFYRTDFTTQIISGQLLQSYITTQAKGPNEGGSGEVLLFSILTDSKDALRQMTDGISPAAKQSQQPSGD